MDKSIDHMTTVNILTLIMSSVAILLSGLTFYFNFFHKKVSLIGTLLSFATEAPDDPMHMEFECSLGNTGNRELLIRDIDVDLIGADTNKGFLVPEIVSKEIPSIIKPGQILLVKFLLPRLFVNEAAKNGCSIKLDFDVVSSCSKHYVASKILKPTLREEFLMENSWQSAFTLGETRN